MKKLLEKFFGSEPSTALVKAEVKPEDNPRLVVVKGEVHFEIFEDGNGNLSAKHKNGKWLERKEHLTDFYEFRRKFYDLKSCHEDCFHYIRSRQLTKVGTIEFIPSK
jgi:hypothetical protein